MEYMDNVAVFVGFASLISVAGVLGAGFFESLISAPNFNVNIPDSLTHYRAFLSVRNPGHFFRIAVPVSMALVILGLVLSIGTNVLWNYIIALVCILVGDAITFAVHFPRNKILFMDPLPNDAAPLQKAAREWARWNWVRLVLLFAATVSIAFALAA